MFSNLLCRSAVSRAPMLSRSFAKAAATSKSHKPLIDVYGIHARYANATYMAASKADVMEKVEGELLAIQATAKSNENFQNFLQNPLISREDKVKQVTDLLGKKTTPTTLNLMTTLAGNARLSELDKVVDTYGDLMKAFRGQVQATITSAEELTKAQLDAVQKAMMAQIGTGKTVQLTSQVDPTLIGGLQIQVGDQFLDLSVSSKIDAISRTAV